MCVSYDLLYFHTHLSILVFAEASHLGFPLAGGQALIPSMAKAGTAENSWPYALRVPLPTSYGADEGGSAGPLDFDPSDKPSHYTAGGRRRKLPCKYRQRSKSTW